MENERNMPEEFDALKELIKGGQRLEEQHRRWQEKEFGEHKTEQRNQFKFVHSRLDEIEEKQDDLGAKQGTQDSSILAVKQESVKESKKYLHKILILLFITVPASIFILLRIIHLLKSYPFN